MCFMLFIKKLLFTGIAIISTSTGTVSAMQIIPQYDPGGDIGRGLGEGMSQGMSQNLQRAMIEKSREREEKKQISRESAILEKILKEYEPSKKDSVVLKILQSELTASTKKMVINTLNAQHKEWEGKNKKHDLFSWFK